MMDAAANDAMDALEACPCCLLGPQQRCLKTPYTHLDNTEIYSEMLKECFNIQLDVASDVCGICEECVARLRDASHFKRQVQRSQAQLQQRLARALQIIEAEPPAVVKSEMADEDGESANLSVEPPVEMADDTGTCEESADCEEADNKSEVAHDDGTSDDSLVLMKEDPESEAAPGERCDHRVKEEPLSEAMPPDVDSSFPEHTEEEESSTEEAVCVKEEPSWENSADSCVVSEAAVRAGLYTDHTVKDELFVGPECVQPRDIVYTLRAAAAQPVTDSSQPEPTSNKQLLRDCSVRLERVSVSDAVSRGESCIEQSGDNSANAVIGAVAQSPRPPTRAKRTLATTSPVSVGEANHECPECQSIFDHPSSLVMHMDQVHPVTQDTSAQGVYICDHCGKRCTRRLNLINHMKVHTISRTMYTPNINEFMVIRHGKKPYGCKLCGQAFENKYCLGRHTVVHTKLKLFSCEICNKSFKYKHDLTQHVKGHTVQKRYTCELCPKSFKQKTSVNLHMKTAHTDRRPYICEICRKRFRYSHTMTNHYRIHTGVKPYSCQVCKKAFTEKGQLKIHTRVHTGQKPYVCEICDRRFSKKIYLTRHRSRVHT